MCSTAFVRLVALDWIFYGSPNVRVFVRTDGVNHI